MPQTFTNEVVYDYPPAHTLSCFHRKYPNPFVTHVYTVDTLSRTIDPETGIIRSERLLGVQQGPPAWIKKLFSLPETSYVREVVFIDPGEMKATCMSMNLSLKEYVSCLELITYSPYKNGTAPEKPSKPLEPGQPGPGALFPSTLFSQRATFISEFKQPWIASSLEKESVKRFGKNAGAGKKGFEWVLAGGQEKASGTAGSKR